MASRSAGILFHVSSLPSPYGIGDLGPQAYQFVDFLAQTGQKFWQILPLNPTDPVYGNSPYSSNAAFAANILFISPEMLLNDRLLDQQDLSGFGQEMSTQVHYEEVSHQKRPLFDKAFEKLGQNSSLVQEFQQFCQGNKFWLDDYAVFSALKDIHQGALWTTWPDGLRDRDTQALEKFTAQNKARVEKTKFLQFIFAKQWAALKQYCGQKNVQLIGDIPIYVNYDSVDVWANPKLFELNADYSLKKVAGVPPDYFSETGQRWGNPVYDWAAIQAEQYAWWISRIKQNLTFFDYIRIDHFRGLVDYWSIPAEEKTAVKGEWEKGPGDDFFDAIKGAFPQLPIIAEDLGIITDQVTQTMEKYGFPGMKILMFAFGGEIKTHPYIPENYSENCVVYTGTHDNNTVQGWCQEDMTKDEKRNLSAYLNKDLDLKVLHWDLIEMALNSKANTAIIPLQDYLGLGAEARINTPSTVAGNWQWRIDNRLLTSELTDRILNTVQESRRA